MQLSRDEFINSRACTGLELHQSHILQTDLTHDTPNKDLTKMDLAPFIFITFILLSLIINGFDGIDINNIKEQKCPKNLPKATTELNLEWASQVGNWYFPLASQLDSYLTAAEIRNVKVSDVRPHDLYYRACIKFSWDLKTSFITGFGNKKVDAPLQPNSDGSSRFQLLSLAIGGTTTPILTDNKTFILFYNCWDDGEASWGTTTSIPVLPEKTKKLIFKHVKKLGFDEKHVTELRYESCEATAKEVAAADGKHEL